ncbi:MAG: NUDIX domain-containing protein [Phycisphaerae bacterium]|nr:NUDIX domain-containing protein [Phycisphaerae bacterium]
MDRKSAGLVMYRTCEGQVEVFLIHPGGPFWVRKEQGAWSIPKGEFMDEDPLEAAQREFQEETGFAASGAFKPLDPIQQAGGKIVHAWAVEGDCDAEAIKSNTFTMEWPPHSGRQGTFPEADRAGWFPLPQARDKILKSQRPLLDQFERTLRPQTT